MALLRQHFQWILPIRRPLHNIPVRNFRIEHRKPIMMPRRNRDVLHPRGLSQRNPGPSIKLLRIKKLRQPLILMHREMPLMKNPLPIPQYAIHAPMNKHPKLRILKFLPSLQILGRRHIAPRRTVSLSHRRTRNKQHKQRHDKCGHGRLARELLTTPQPSNSPTLSQTHASSPIPPPKSASPPQISPPVPSTKQYPPPTPHQSAPAHRKRPAPQSPADAPE